MQPSNKRSRDDDASGQRTAGGSAVGEDELCETLNNAVNASVKAAFKSLEEERARVLAEAAKEVEGMKRELVEERAALEAEKASMEKAHAFQSDKIMLDVGGHKFSTSRQTLTSIPAGTSIQRTF